MISELNKSYEQKSQSLFQQLNHLVTFYACLQSIVQRAKSIIETEDIIELLTISSELKSSFLLTQDQVPEAKIPQKPFLDFFSDEQLLISHLQNIGTIIEKPQVLQKYPLHKRPPSAKHMKSYSVDDIKKNSNEQHFPQSYANGVQFLTQLKHKQTQTDATPSFDVSENLCIQEQPNGKKQDELVKSALMNAGRFLLKLPLKDSNKVKPQIMVTNKIVDFHSIENVSQPATAYGAFEKHDKTHIKANGTTTKYYDVNNKSDKLSNDSIKGEMIPAPPVFQRSPTPKSSNLKTAIRSQKSVHQSSPIKSKEVKLLPVRVNEQDKTLLRNFSSVNQTIWNDIYTGNVSKQQKSKIKFTFDSQNPNVFLSNFKTVAKGIGCVDIVPQISLGVNAITLRLDMVDHQGVEIGIKNAKGMFCCYEVCGNTWYAKTTLRSIDKSQWHDIESDRKTEAGDTVCMSFDCNRKQFVITISGEHRVISNVPSPVYFYVNFIDDGFGGSFEQVSILS